MSRRLVRRSAKREGGRYTPMTRRDVLRAAAGLASLESVGLSTLAVQPGRFNIGACDWSLGQRARTDALGVAKQLGLDGVQVSMGSVDNDLQLRRPDVQRAYRDAAAVAGVRIGGVALDLMNQVPYKSDPRTEPWVSDSIDVARALDVRVILLAFFEKGDLRGDPEGQAKSSTG
jgi:L-ribulose-5-phosphate 3-epimerase